MPCPTPYQYLPLDVSRNEIRLVVLAPSYSFSAQVSCSLVPRSLDSDVAFEALSYTWGDAECKRLISLNGLEFSVAKNLDIALRHLRYSEDERSIWVDALCINQDDITERNQQVTKMRNIYKRAAKVVVWLGQASSSSDIAFSFLVTAASNRCGIEDWMSKAWKSPNVSVRWSAIHDIANRDYWRRVWIIQEIFFAQSIIVRCGFRTMRWADFILVFNMIIYSPHLISPLSSITGNRETNLMLGGILTKCHLPTSIDHLRKKAENGEDLSLEILLMTYRSSFCTDPRDKVYGIVGIAGQYEDQRALKIDYSMSKRETYIEAMRCVMERGKKSKEGPLNIICCGLPDFSDGSLPSWVPDWVPPPEHTWRPELGSLSYFFKANGAFPPPRAFRIKDGALIVQGLRIATLNHFGAVSVPFQVPAHGTIDSKFLDEYPSPKGAFCIAAKLAMSDSKHMPHSYKSQNARKKQFTRTMLCNQAMPTFDGPMPYTTPSAKTLQDFCEEIMSFDETNNNWEAVLCGGRGPSNGNLLGVVCRNLRSYRFCVSSTGLFLMAPSSSRIGDVVCVIFGCDMPVVLRRNKGGPYTFVGGCYADGIMYGEAMEGLADGNNRVVELRIH